MLAGATLFAAANVGVGWLYALGFLFLSYFLLAFGLAAVTFRGLRVSIRPGERTVAGEPLSCTVALEHAGRTTRRFVSLLAPPLGARRGVGPLRSYLVPEEWGHSLVLEVRPGDRTLAPLAVPAPRRGVYSLPPLVVQAPAFGLGAVHRTIRAQGEVLVRPRVVPLPRLRWLQGSLAADLDERPAAPAGGYELIRSIREYRPGDSMKSVHWRSTARTGELRIKETEGDASAGGVAIALDLGPAHTPESYEHAIVVAASLCAYAHAQGIAVTLYAQSGEPADQGLEGQLDWLARLPLARDPRRTPPLEGGKQWLKRLFRGHAKDGVPSSSTSISGRDFPPSRGGARGGSPSSHAILITPRAIGVEAYGYSIYVGPGPAPQGMIACPPEKDLADSLGGAHGA